MPTLAVATLVFLVIGTGVSYAAEKTKPGETLYSVKLNVTEGMRTSIALSSEAKIQTEARLLERRLVEAEQVAADGILRSEIRGEIQENFSAHADRFKARAKELRKSDPKAALDIGARYEAALEAHATVLSTLALKAENAGEREEIEILLARVREEQGEAAELRIQAEGDVLRESEANLQSALQAKRKEADQALRQARIQIAAHRSELGAEAIVRAESRLLVAERTIVEAKADEKAGSRARAFVLFSNAYRIAEEARLLVLAALDLRMDIDAYGEAIAESGDASGAKADAAVAGDDLATETNLTIH